MKSVINFPVIKFVIAVVIRVSFLTETIGKIDFKVSFKFCLSVVEIVAVTFSKTKSTYASIKVFDSRFTA